MKRTIGMTASAVGLLAVGAIASSLVSSSAANGTPTAPTASKPATFTMYANVDAEGDLGSHHDAEKAAVFNPSDPYYVVIFSKPIGHCAASVQVGKAGGPDKTSPAASQVIPAGHKSAKAFVLDFTNANGDSIKDPFMMTVTCNN